MTVVQCELILNRQHFVLIVIFEKRCLCVFWVGHYQDVFAHIATTFTDKLFIVIANNLRSFFFFLYLLSDLFSG